ncbi:MAG: M14 family zinc carboxypeptidase [Bacteroidota bacterium]
MDIPPILNEEIIQKVLGMSAKVDEPRIIGLSREGRDISGYHLGSGNFQISLIGGCHSDEPVGPMLLKKLVNYLLHLPENDDLLQHFSWHIVTHVNPDGESINRQWYDEDMQEAKLSDYLKYVYRELPGDDIEFGFPIEGEFTALRPENQVVYDFWKEVGKPFDLHASLHGMAWSYGPWFLIDRNWIDRSELIQHHGKTKVDELGYTLHDVDRKGEKGFTRINEGFCTRPDSQAMRDHFLQLDDPEQATKFHPSSMESVRSFSNDCLTLVSEMPLFTVPKSNFSLAWPSPELDRWKDQLNHWKMDLVTNRANPQNILDQAMQADVRPMPITDQMILQWTFITSGIQQVLADRV